MELVLAGVELDVLDAQRAAADGVGLLVGVLVARVRGPRKNAPDKL